MYTGLTLVATLVSGGFAVVQPDSQLSINASEAYPLEDFSADVSFTFIHFHLSVGPS